MKNEKISHSENLGRLNKISGQINGIKKMIEEERYCIDIITQVRAVRSALKSIENNILEKHLQHCVSQYFNEEDKDKKILELKKLFNKYDE